MMYEAPIREPLILGDKTNHEITEDICRPIEGKANKYWWWCFIAAVAALLWWVLCVSITVGEGIGMWGITNFVWWVGIGHAGTLISAVLLLFRQKWRLSINRSAEAMTIFAVICAATFLLTHIGRPWLPYWLLPLPNQFGSLWVNFNSPLVWDTFAVSTYFSVSLVFWYTGLIPDFAVVRDRAKTKANKFWYGLLAFGWTGSSKNWQRFEEVSLVLAGMSTPLVLSVHTIVSMDFATSILPGWHTTIFPPYFVAGAIFSGFAMVQTLLIITRKVLSLENYITTLHIDMMNRIILVTGSIVGIAYITEFFIAWYSGVEYESYCFINRATGYYWWAYASMMTCNVISPQLFWVKSLRTNITFTFILSIVVNIGMWFERFVIIVSSLHRAYLPSEWGTYHPSWVEVGIFIGSLGLFFTCFLLFARFFPVIAMSELKTITKSSSTQAKRAALEHGHSHVDHH
jgi:molybdopterin-containing oxidoreductase family membrane subunit